MFTSIRSKVLLVVAGGLVLITALILVFTARQVYEYERGVFMERGRLAALELGRRAQVLFDLGLRIDEFRGFEAQCAEIVNGTPGVIHAALSDDSGTMYQSDGIDAWSTAGSDPGTPPLTPTTAASGEGPIWVHARVAGTRISSARAMVAIDPDAIDAAVRSLLLKILLGSLVIKVAGILALMALLGRMLGTPARQLIAHIESIGPDHMDVPGTALHSRRDEIGVIAQSFQKLVARLARTQTELREANRALSDQALHLEQLVAQRTRELQSANQELEVLAHTDPLTRLPNRLHFKNDLQARIERLREAVDRPGHLAVLMMDLDGFKDVNDRFGHDMGDYALKVIARRVDRSLRDSDRFYRLGGDEFVLIAEDFQRDEDLGLIANRLSALIAQPFRRDGPELRVGVSIGIAVLDAAATISADELVKAADEAMYSAKRGDLLFAFAPGLESAPPREDT
ncbi:MAG: diguanylate cyclase domain-containing protein [Gammaproteobacteria bacterium]